MFGDEGTPDFLDSAITSYNLKCFSQPRPIPPPPAAADDDDDIATISCCNWRYRPCRICQNAHPHGWQQRGRPIPSTFHLSSAPAHHAAPHYTRIYSHVHSFSTHFYAYLQTHVARSSRHNTLSNPSHIPETLNPESPEIYERRLSSARWAARTVGSFYNLSTFLALCSLTWATVVLLGAFVDDLDFIDYVMVTSLLLLEAVRLASAAFFTILLTHGLARLSQDPQNIIHGKDDHYRRALAARILSSLVQTLLILPSFVCPIIRLRNLEYDNHKINNSLLIFYLLILCNAIVSSITLFCSSASFFYLRDRYDQSTLRYYDDLLQRAISGGVIQADDFGVFQFAYTMLGKEFARIVQPEAVVKNHRKLIEYLYRHRLGQDFLLIFLEENDAFVQQAAVNMAGFWADPSKKVGLKEVKLAKKVLRGMADKVGSGQLGWAAVNSFGGIARRDPRILAETTTSGGVPLLDSLAEHVDGKSSGSLAYVRTLVLYYHYSLEKGKLEVPLLRKERELEGKLRQLLAEAKVQRARLFAAYLLHLMGHLNESCYDGVAAIQPSQDAYWFREEMDLLHFIRGKCHIPFHQQHFPAGFIRNDDNFGPDGKWYF